MLAQASIHLAARRPSETLTPAWMLAFANTTA